jgi:hypothetical protein
MMRQQSCGNCSAFVKNKDLTVAPGQVHQGWCRAKPPSLVQVMVPVTSKFAPQGQQMAPGWQGVFPPTASDAWCREWEQAHLPLFDDKVVEHEHAGAIDLAASDATGRA